MHGCFVRDCDEVGIDIAMGNLFGKRKVAEKVFAEREGGDDGEEDVSFRSWVERLVEDRAISVVRGCTGEEAVVRKSPCLRRVFHDLSLRELW